MNKLAALFLFFPLVVCAQLSDTAFVSSAIHHAKEIHAKRITGESLLFNGIDYAKYIPLHDEFPYFLSDDWVSGSISYDDQLYEKAWLLYDITNDNVIIENYNFSNTIQLLKERIQFFTLEGHTFVQINHPSLSRGFYELLYNGETRVLARHTKQIQELIRFGEFRYIFEEKTRYYIFKNNRYYLVRNKKSVLNVLKDKKQELVRQYRKSNTNFNADRTKGIIDLAFIYDSISK